MLWWLSTTALGKPVVPEVYWIVFAYLGQMFGLLPARFPILATLFVSAILFARNAAWGDPESNTTLLLGTLAGLALMFSAILFVKQLNLKRKNHHLYKSKF